MQAICKKNVRDINFCAILYKKITWRMFDTNLQSKKIVKILQQGVEAVQFVENDTVFI